MQASSVPALRPAPGQPNWGSMRQGFAPLFRRSCGHTSARTEHASIAHAYEQRNALHKSLLGIASTQACTTLKSLPTLRWASARQQSTCRSGRAPPMLHAHCQPTVRTSAVASSSCTSRATGSARSVSQLRPGSAPSVPLRVAWVGPLSS